MRGIAALLLLLLAASLIPAPAASVSHAGAPWPIAGSAAAAPTPAVVTHGDLVVGPGNSPYLIAPGSSTHQTYYQGGNVTVLPGGKLVILQTDFLFVQYVGSTGSIASRLNHLYTFNDQGSVWLESSVVSDDLGVLNAYPKVTVNVSAGGQFYANSSSLAFAGWFTVSGAGSAAWVNASTIAANPQNHLLPNVSVGANDAVTNDSVYAPSISVTTGGHLTIDGTTQTGTYADNRTLSGAPTPNALSDAGSTQISSTQSNTYTSYATPNAPLALVQDTLYRSVAAGSVTIDYAATIDESSTSGNLFKFGGNADLGTINYLAANSQVTVPLTAAAVADVNAIGVAALYQDATQGSPGGVTLGTTNSATAVSISDVQINLVPATSFNTTVNGTGSQLTVADSTLDLNWYPVAPFPRPPTAPPQVQPWSSKKLLVQNHAHAYLTDMTTSTAPNPSNTTDISAVLPDSTGTAYFYRWMAIPVYGAGSQPVTGGSALAFYAFDTNQANNATANALNNLGTSDPDLAAYVAAWDTVHGIASYGSTVPTTGMAYLCLAAGNLTSSTLQDGVFLGDYHVQVTVSGGRAGPPVWFDGAVSAYPLNMNPASADVQTPTVFPLYRPALSVASTSVTVGAVNHTANTNDTLAIGEVTNITVTVANVGTGAVASYNVTLIAYPSSKMTNFTKIGNYSATVALAVGSEFNVTFPWVVNESATGVPNPPVSEEFQAAVIWNGGVAPIGGLAEGLLNKTIVPSYMSLKFTAPGGSLNPGQSYIGTVNLIYSGSDSAWVNVTATSSAGLYILSTEQFHAGRGQTVELFLPSAMANGQYSIEVTAYHQGRFVAQNITDAFTVGPPPAGPLPWYEQKLAGLLPIWLLIVIVAAVAAVAGGVLFMFARTARGKLVECGECGTLIPEDATVCRNCGAEFEPDLVRCSRCGSTIPANSQVCPECAAQLLGKGESETSDPERQGYADYVEHFRVDARKELGTNYNEGAFWDWWKRQSTYLPFSQWKVQQAGGSRAGGTAPPPRMDDADSAPPAAPPRRGGGSGGAGAPPAAAPTASRPPPARAAAPPAAPMAPTPTPAAAPAAAPASAGQAAPMKACSNCGKEIPPEYLVCPFCGAVTQ